MEADMFTIKYVIDAKKHTLNCYGHRVLLDMLWSLFTEYYEYDDMTIDVYDNDDKLIWSLG